jgi:hypothetical protein
LPSADGAAFAAPIRRASSLDDMMPEDNKSKVQNKARLYAICMAVALALWLFFISNRALALIVWIALLVSFALSYKYKIHALFLPISLCVLVLSALPIDIIYEGWGWGIDIRQCMYGHPSDEGIKKAARGEIYLMGCCVDLFPVNYVILIGKRPLHRRSTGPVYVK